MEDNTKILVIGMEEKEEKKKQVWICTDHADFQLLKTTIGSWCQTRQTRLLGNFKYIYLMVCVVALQ